MGFWAGMNEGLTYVLDKRAAEASEDKARAFQRESREEERRYQEKQQGLNYLREQTLAAIPLLVERRERDKQTAIQKAQIGGYFEDRTNDLPEETRNAFTNLITQDTTYSAALMETVQRTEATLGRALTGSDILKITNIIEKTKPEGVSLEDWTKQASSMTVTSDSGIDFDQTLERLFSGEVSPEEIQQIQMDILTPEGTSLGILPDFSTHELLGVEPSVQKSLMEIAEKRVANQFQLDKTKTQEEVDAVLAAGEEIDPKSDLGKKSVILSRIENEPDSDTRNSMLMQYYAPIVLPQLAEQDARYTAVYPEFFQAVPDNRPPPTVIYDYVDGILTPRATQ